MNFPNLVLFIRILLLTDSEYEFIKTQYQIQRDDIGSTIEEIAMMGKSID